MSKLFFLTLFFYNILALATLSNSYDYDELDGSTLALPLHSLTDDRRNWRKKALLKPYNDHLTSDRRRQDFDSPRFLEEINKFYGGMNRQRDPDMSGYRASRRYDGKQDLQLPLKSSELAHSSTYIEKDAEKVRISAMNCKRPHERYETCFSGCASVTCDNPRDRLRPCYPFCEAGCICVHPYVRDDRTHKCVLPEDCTKGLKGIPDLEEDV